jgi:hypothetical protein
MREHEGNLEVAVATVSPIALWPMILADELKCLLNNNESLATVGTSDRAIVEFGIW